MEISRALADHLAEEGFFDRDSISFKEGNFFDDSWGHYDLIYLYPDRRMDHEKIVRKIWDEAAPNTILILNGESVLIDPLPRRFDRAREHVLKPLRKIEHDRRGGITVYVYRPDEAGGG